MRTCELKSIDTKDELKKIQTRIELEWYKFEIIIHLADQNETLLSWNAVDIQWQQTKAMLSSFRLIESKES